MKKMADWFFYLIGIRKIGEDFPTCDWSKGPNFYTIKSKWGNFNAPTKKECFKRWLRDLIL